MAGVEVAQRSRRATRQAAARGVGLPRAWARWSLPAGALVACLLVTLALYGRALGFSFFLDDAYDTTRTQERSYWQLLTQPLPNGYPYFRPIPFVLWKATFDLLGRYDTVLLHGVSLLGHALAGWCVVLLLRRAVGWRWALLPGAFFLAFPWSYQAVTIFGAMCHPLSLPQVLGALVCWLRGRERGSAGWLAAAGVLAVTALLTHESAVLLGPALLAIELWRWRSGRARRPSAWLLLPLLAEAGYLLVWFVVLPKPRGDHVVLRDVLWNSAFGLEGVAFPVTRQLSWLVPPAALEAHPLRWVVGTGLAGVLAGLLLHRTGRQGWLGLLALAWAAAAFAPAATRLTFPGYVVNSPRLLYAASPGIAAFWGLLPRAVWRAWGEGVAVTRWRHAAAVTVPLALAAAVLVQSVQFIAMRTDWFAAASTVAEGIIRLGAAHPGGQLLLVNVPAWFARDRYEWPIGRFGVQVEPEYVGLERVVLAGANVRATVESRSLAPPVHAWRLTFGPHGEPIDHQAIDQRLRAGFALGVTEFLPDGIVVREPGRLLPGGATAATPLATFADALELAEATAQRTGSRLVVQLRWQVRQPLGRDAMIWLRVRDAAGRIVAERRDYALAGMSAPRLWRLGDAVEDWWLLPLPAEAAGPLQVELQLVATADWRPLPGTPRPVVTIPAP